MPLPTAVKALSDKCECLGDQNNKLRKGCKLFLIEKLQDRLSLNIATLRYSYCLAHHHMINYKDLCILKFEKSREAV